MNAIINLQGITRRLGTQPVLHNLSLTIPHGQTCAIIGPPPARAKAPCSTLLACSTSLAAAG